MWWLKQPDEWADVDQRCAKLNEFWLRSEPEKGAQCTSTQSGHINKQVVMIAFLSQSYGLQLDSFPRRSKSSWRSLSRARDEFQRTWLLGRAWPLERCFVILAWVPHPRLGDTYKGHCRGRRLVVNQQGNTGHGVLLDPVLLSCSALALVTEGEIRSYKAEFQTWIKQWFLNTFALK